MKLLLAALFCAALASSAYADGRAFPPDDCSEAAPFMSFTGIDGTNTFCNSGQTIFRNALPDCTAGQQVSYDGKQFTCDDKPNVPTCAADQVLTYTGNSYLCIKRTDTIPTCATGQYLTYNGNSYQCVMVQKLALPSCTDNQYAWSDGTTLSCKDFAATSVTQLSSYQMYMQRVGSAASMCQATAESHVISTNASYVLLNSAEVQPDGPGTKTYKTNCYVSNQGGSLSKAKLAIRNASGAIVYQSPSEIDCGSNQETLTDSMGWTTSVSSWANSPRRVDLPPSGMPYTITTEGQGCMGYSANSLTTYATFVVTEYGK